MSIRMVLEDVTERILVGMQAQGWYREGERERELTHEPPTVWDLNNGFCEEWAVAVEEEVPGARMVWLEDLGPGDFGYSKKLARGALSHAVIQYEGRFYDAQCLDGVEDPSDLPLVRRVPRSFYVSGPPASSPVDPELWILVHGGFDALMGHPDDIEDEEPLRPWHIEDVELRTAVLLALLREAEESLSTPKQMSWSVVAASPDTPGEVLEALLDSEIAYAVATLADQVKINGNLPVARIRALWNAKQKPDDRIPLLHNPSLPEDLLQEFFSPAFKRRRTSRGEAVAIRNPNVPREILARAVEICLQGRPGVDCMAVGENPSLTDTQKRALVDHALQVNRRLLQGLCRNKSMTPGVLDHIAETVGVADTTVLNWVARNPNTALETLKTRMPKQGILATVVRKRITELEDQDGA